MRPPYFVTGTDTEIGKTFIAAALLELARERGLRCAALKPVAAGCSVVDGEFVNDDALQMIAASGTDLDYRTVNPVAILAQAVFQVAIVVNDACVQQIEDPRNIGEEPVVSRSGKHNLT